MKLIVPLILLGTLSTSTEALQCARCADDSCSSMVPVTCSSETMCITATRYVGASPANKRIFKGCATSSICPTKEFQKFSMRSLQSHALVLAKCCDTDKCNSDTLSAQIHQLYNGRRCFTCIPGAGCSFPLNCEGEEDRCFQGSVTTSSGNSTVFGCISQNVCEANHDLGMFLQNIGGFASGPTCCSANLCNNSNKPLLQ